ncbi:hypothetical protein BMW23_0718 [Bodo saltans virus]|uniref:Uncharacterized protein n=1 Tax=Bodo saltans virus TaxID=2024608 RepID=A0A2H4UV77_9VIRU|nr:hypothetical protein QJ851_gp0701 [Bodo saltans virus]ATZ80764.1 hypothetical protein BMW23_0718 [Bodo saltans virus]
MKNQFTTNSASDVTKCDQKHRAYIQKMQKPPIKIVKDLFNTTTYPIAVSVHDFLGNDTMTDSKKTVRFYKNNDVIEFIVGHKNEQFVTELLWDNVFPFFGWSHSYKWGGNESNLFSFNHVNNVVIEKLVLCSKAVDWDKKPIAVNIKINVYENPIAQLCLSSSGKIKLHFMNTGEIVNVYKCEYHKM